MDIKAIIQKIFTEQLEKEVSEHEEEIREALSKQTSKVVVDVRELELEDISKRISDPTYLNDEFIQYTENGIKLLYVTDNMIEMLKSSLPRDIKELTVPSELLQDIRFLEEFPNLETLNIADYGELSPEAIDYIATNTNIKNMTFRSSRTINGLKGKDGINIIDGGNIIAQYGKLTMFHRGYQGKWHSNIHVYTSEFNDKNMATLGALFDGIKAHIPEIRDVSLTAKDDFGINTEFSMSISEGKVSKMTIKEVTPTQAATVYKSMKKRGTEVTSTQMYLENTSYDDIYQLKQMDQTSKCTLKYKSGDTTTDATYDEFLNMHSTIDYYKELIEASDLSPVEKVAYVYDILKTMRYQENESNKQRSRNIHAIVTDGTIVCVGYAAFAEQLLTELGVDCLKVSVTCLSDTVDDAGHARNFVRVDDDKYNIHGLYAMDITWDSDKDIAVIEEDGEKTIVSRPNDEMKKQVVDKYDSLVLYRHFLTPMETYESRYPEEINPTLYEAYKAGKTKTLVEESKKIASGQMRKFDSKNAFVLEQHQRLFRPDEGYLTVERYLEAKKPSLETFEQILSTVRQAQGYTQEETKQEVDRVVELHQMLNDQNPNAPNHFFKPTTK